MSALPRLAVLLFFLILFSFPPSPQAQPRGTDPLRQLLAENEALEERLKRIEANQKAIQERQEKILEELNRLRIWVRRS